MTHLAAAAGAAISLSSSPPMVPHAASRRARVLSEGSASAVEALGLLDKVLADFGFLQKAMRAGTGAAIVGALGAMPVSCRA